MNKVVILVEDDLSRLEDLLLNIQSILFVASKKKLSNAPQEQDTEICILHVVEEEQENYRKQFENFRRILESREQNINENERIHGLQLTYRYQTAAINQTQYPDNCKECKEIILNQIREIGNEKEYVVLLDVVLNKKKDTDIVLKNNKKKPILSQLLYGALQQQCIPYTTYTGSDSKFLEMWCKSVTPPAIAYEKEYIEGNAIYKPFRNAIYKKLNIGEDIQ